MQKLLACLLILTLPLATLCAASAQEPADTANPFALSPEVRPTDASAFDGDWRGTLLISGDKSTPAAAAGLTFDLSIAEGRVTLRTVCGHDDRTTASEGTFVDGALNFLREEDGASPVMLRLHEDGVLSASYGTGEGEDYRVYRIICEPI